ncbi:MAG: CCA tRNA nucleotidyltransferase [Candidatus Omnitrophota bacterium]
MKEYLKKLPQGLQDLICLAGEISAATDNKVYLVGGFVRDLILGVKNFDLDIVVEGDGIKFAEELATRLKVKLIRHKRFGTATLVLDHSLKIDIATAREECYPTPACLPLVKSGSVKDDLKRRDFSINAMSVSLNPHDYGKLVDFFHGLDDLCHREIRILHDLSFIDDPTRILRAIRFEQRFDFKIEPKTLKLLKVAVKLKALQKVQPQRLRDELILMLKEVHPIKQIKRMQQLVGLNFIHPHLKIGKNNYLLLKSVEREVSWFKKNCSLRRHPDVWLIYFMAILDHFSVDSVKTIFNGFVFRRGEEKRILDYKKINPKFIKHLKNRQAKPSKIFSLLNPLSYEAIILIKAKYKAKFIAKHIDDFFKIYHSLRIHITGSDLLRQGFSAGPFFKEIFTKVLVAKLDGIVQTKEEELIFIRKLAKIK